MQEQLTLQPVTDLQIETLETATARYQAAVDLREMDYLMERGLSGQTLDTFRLGVASDPLPEHKWYRGMIAIPYIVDGKPVQMRFRCIEDHEHTGHGKYNTMLGDPARMFNVDALSWAQSEIHVTEGEFDAMVLCQLGLPAVAVAGVNSFKKHHARMLAGFNRIYAWGDPDEAGTGFIQMLRQRFPRSAVGAQSELGDVTETYLRGGEEAVFACIEEKGK